MELTSVNNVSVNHSEIKIHLSGKELDDAVNAVYRNESKKINVPGFRRGHAPRAIIEKYYGNDVFFEAAINHLYPGALSDALEKSKLDVVSVTKFNVDSISKENGVDCTISVVTKPEVEIEGYKGIAVYRDPLTVTDGEIDQEIERVRERNSRTVTVEGRAAENGDITEIDFEGFVDGEPFEGGKGENFELTLGAGQFIEGFEEQVAGHLPGDEFQVNVTFPDDYHAEELKSKPAVFNVKLHEIKHKELPVVDDEFVKDVSEFDSVADYRKSIEESILNTKRQEDERAVENQVADAVVERVKVELPEEMIEEEIDGLIDNFNYRLRSSGLSLETYLKYMNTDTEGLRKQYRPNAERQLKLRLALEKIAEQEELSVSEEEIEEQYGKLAADYGVTVEAAKKSVSEEGMRRDALIGKAADFVKENVTVNPEPAPEEEKETEEEKNSEEPQEETQPETSEN